MLQTDSHIQLPAAIQIPSLILPALVDLSRPTAYLALTDKLPRAVIMTRHNDQQQQIGTVSTKDAHWLFDHGYIELTREGRISIYKIAAQGRYAVENMARAERAPVFQSTPKLRRLRETPIQMLARKKGVDGKKYLKENHVKSALILLSDYKLAEFDLHPVGSVAEVINYQYSSETDASILSAHKRLCGALSLLQEDMANIALRCCCLQEGVETAERALAWPARSGKIVLRIALALLSEHYRETGARDYCLI